MTLNCNPRPDSWSFRYGRHIAPDETVTEINVMPPKAEWDRDLVLPGYEPHARDWVVRSNPFY